MRYLGFCLILLGLLTGCTPKNKTVEAAPAPSLGPMQEKAVSAYEQGEYKESLALYKRLLEASPSNPEYLNNIGAIFLSTGDTQGALEAFERASLLAPENPEYLVNIGLAEIQTQDFEDSLPYFDKALAIQPNQPEALYGKGLAYLHIDEPEVALGFFRKASLAAPAKLDYLFMKACASQKSELWDDAISDYLLFIKKAKNREKIATAYSNMGVCRMQAGDEARGVNELNQAIALDDSKAIFFYNRGWGFQRQQKFDKAVQDYTRAIARDVNFPEAYINRGELNYILGNEKKACSDLKRACDMGFCDTYKQYEAAGKCSE